MAGSRARTVFGSIAAQPDNLGDIAIRQAALDLTSASGLRHVVFAGRMPDAYIEAFDLPIGTVLTRSATAFPLSLLGAVITRRAHLVLAPGPYRAAGGASLVKAIALGAGVVAVRITGGEVLAAGRAIRGRHPRGLSVQRWIARKSSLYAVRDQLSSQLLGIPVRVAPDLALARMGAGAGDRNRLAISLRGDRPVNAVLLRELVEYGRERNLHPVLVTQVRRDDAGHADLANELGIAHIEWGDRAHSEQIRRVREVYAQTHTVVSDRLHALIFGLQYSARPVALKHADPDKLVTTLADVVPLRVIDAGATDHGLRDEAELDSTLLTALAKARSDLQELQHDITAVLTGTTQAAKGASNVH